MIRQELNPVTCKLDEKRPWIKNQKQWNQRKNLKCVGWGPWLRLSLLPQTVETLQVRQRDVSLRCHCDFWPFSLAQEAESHLCPLHYLRREKREEKRKRRKFYIYPDVTHTHTHTRQSRGKPWKARGRKKRTRDGPTAKNSAGGEGNRRTSGTNLHGETDLTKTEHTPKPNDTLRS